MGRAVAAICPAALEKNYSYIKSIIAPECGICAMVKADAYGHGLVLVARIMERLGARYLGVADASEALSVRRAGINAPVLICGRVGLDELALLAEFRDIELMVYSFEYAKEISGFACRRGRSIRCHLKVDTGMGRLGFVCGDGRPSADILGTLALPGLEFYGICTHFASSERRDGEYTPKQFGLFCGLIDALSLEGYDFALRHAANSGAIMNFPQTHLDMVRPGIMLYGYCPTGQDNPLLVKALELYGHVEQVKLLKKGSKVSYGSLHTCERDTLAAVVGLGYGDGVSWHLLSKGCVVIRGRRAPILGRVCMDHFTVDVSHIDGVTAGDAAYFIGGRAADTAIWADEIAALSGTISYEVLCRLSNSRVCRVEEMREI